MRHFDTGFMADGISAIQDLLLICRFAIYHHIGLSHESFSINGLLPPSALDC